MATLRGGKKREVADAWKSSVVAYAAERKRKAEMAERGRQDKTEQAEQQWTFDC